MIYIYNYIYIYLEIDDPAIQLGGTGARGKKNMFQFELCKEYD